MKIILYLCFPQDDSEINYTGNLVIFPPSWLRRIERILCKLWLWTQRDPCLARKQGHVLNGSPESQGNRVCTRTSISFRDRFSRFPSRQKTEKPIQHLLLDFISFAFNTNLDSMRVVLSRIIGNDHSEVRWMFRISRSKKFVLNT